MLNFRYPSDLVNYPIPEQCRQQSRIPERESRIHPCLPD